MDIRYLHTIVSKLRVIYQRHYYDNLKAFHEDIIPLINKSIITKDVIYKSNERYINFINELSLSLMEYFTLLVCNSSHTNRELYSNNDLYNLFKEFSVKHEIQIKDSELYNNFIEAFTHAFVF